MLDIAVIRCVHTHAHGSVFDSMIASIDTTFHIVYKIYKFIIIEGTYRIYGI